MISHKRLSEKTHLTESPLRRAFLFGVIHFRSLISVSS